MKKTITISLLSVLILSTLIGFLAFTTTNKKGLSCQIITKSYVKGIRRELRSERIQDTLLLFPSPALIATMPVVAIFSGFFKLMFSHPLAVKITYLLIGPLTEDMTSSEELTIKDNAEVFQTKAIYFLIKGRIDESINVFEELAIQDNPDILKTASSSLMILYAHKNNLEKTLYWFHQFALKSYFPSFQYGLALSYSKVCEEETKEVVTEINAKMQKYVVKVKELFPKLDVQAIIDFSKNPDNFPADYVQAYFWANLAVENSFPTALGLKELIAKKMTPEEIEQALSFSY